MVAVAHVDHTDDLGGAELSLARMIQGNSDWSPLLFIPPRKVSGGAFDEIDKNLVVEIGVPQPPGAGAHNVGGTPGGVTSSAGRKIQLLGRVLLQSMALRTNRQFRDADVVHANTARAALIAMVACAGSGRRLVVHLRDAVEQDALGSFNKKLLGLAISRAPGVIANSNFTMRTASEYIAPGTSTTVIPSSIGLSSPRTVVPLKAEVTTIGMLARIAEQKGQELLIRAFADAFRDQAVTLELAGSAAFGTENYFEYLTRLVVELGVADRVRFLGHVTDVWPLVDSWDICVSASLTSESLGQNVLQYLAACRPTVVPDSGGPAEWVRHERTGLLFEEGSQRGLAEALRRLASDEELRRRLSDNLADERPVPTDVEIRRKLQSFFEVVSNR